MIYVRERKWVGGYPEASIGGALLDPFRRVDGLRLNEWVEPRDVRGNGESSSLSFIALEHAWTRRSTGMRVRRFELMVAKTDETKEVGDRR